MGGRASRLRALLSMAAVFMVAVAAFSCIQGNAYANYQREEIIDDADARWTYDENWKAAGTGAPENTEHWTLTVGATAQVKFNGTGYKLYGVKDVKHRYLKLTVDEANPVEVDTYAASRQTNVLLHEATGLAEGDHVLKIELIERHNEAATNPEGASVEYLVATGLDPDVQLKTRIEVGTQTDAQQQFKWKFDGNWTYESGHDIFSGGDDIYSWDSAAKATLRFQGTRIEVGGSKKSGHGVYKFTLDGDQVETVDASASGDPQHQQILYKKEGLADTEHVLEITKESGDAIQLDFADVWHGDVAATSVAIGPEEIGIESGMSKKLPFTIEPYISSGKGVTWKSSDPSVLSVDGSGTVTASEVTQRATVTVSASINDVVSDSVQITVFPKVKSFNAYVGDEKVLEMPANAYEQGTTNFTYSWKDTAWLGDKRVSRISVATRDTAVNNVVVEVSDFRNESGATIPASNVDVRWIREVVGERYQPSVKESYPDIIYGKNDGIDIPAKKLQHAWVTFTIPENAVAGTYKGTLTVTDGTESYPLEYTIEVLGLQLPDPADVDYSVQIWQHPFSATGYYFGKSTVDANTSGSGQHGAPIGTDAPFEKFMDEDFKQYYRGILEDYAAAGGNDLVANIVHEAWGHQCYYSDMGMVKWTKTADGNWKYDYTAFDKWVEFAIECGVLDPATGYGSIKCYSMIPLQNKIFYYDEAKGEDVVETHQPNSQGWKNIWTPFLNDFMKHLDSKGWFDITYISFDEREGITEVAKFIKEHTLNGKSLKTAAAINYTPAKISQHEYLDDVSVVQKIVSSAWSRDQWYDFVDQRRALGLKTTIYTCTGDYPGSSQQSDPGDMYWSALYSESVRSDGYLRWAMDAWVNDMFGDSSYILFEPADGWYIYPLELGEDGEYDPAKLAESPKGYYSSPRYEMLLQGIRDVCKVRYLKSLGGETEQQVTQLFDSLKVPSGHHCSAANEGQRSLTHSESARMYDGLTAIARTVAPAPIPVDKTALQQAVDQAKALVEQDYTPDTWAVFAAALATAEGVLADPAVDQATVDAALAGLKSAQAGLVKVDNGGSNPGDKPEPGPDPDPGAPDHTKPNGGLPSTGDASMLAMGAIAMIGLSAVGVGRGFQKRRK